MTRKYNVATVNCTSSKNPNKKPRAILTFSETKAALLNKAVAAVQEEVGYEISANDAIVLIMGRYLKETEREAREQV